MELSLIHFNARSLRKHFDDICAFLCSTSQCYSVVALCETWLKCSETSFYQYRNFKSEFMCRNAIGTGDTGGGVGLFIAPQLQYTIRNDIVINSLLCEALWIEIDKRSFLNAHKNIGPRSVISTTVH